MHILLVVFILVGGIIFRKNKRGNVIFCGILLFLYAGLRSSSVGIDTLGYERAFYFLKNISFSEIINTDAHGISRDFVFYWFLKLLQFISGDSQIMFILIGGIVAFSISRFIYRYSENVTLSFLIYVGLRFFYFSLTGLRAAIAISIVVFAYKYLEEKKYIKVLITTLIASLFHGSAIIFIISIIIVKINKFISLFIISLSILIINILTNNSILFKVVQLPFFTQYSTYVLNANKESSGTTIIIIFTITTIGYFLSTLNKYDDKNSSEINFIFLKHLFIGIIFYVINFSFANAFRLGHFFTISIIPLMPNIIYNLRFDKKIKFIVKILAIILIIAQYIIIGPGAGTENYLFFWQV